MDFSSTLASLSIQTKNPPGRLHGGFSVILSGLDLLTHPHEAHRLVSFAFQRSTREVTHDTSTNQFCTECKRLAEGSACPIHLPKLAENITHHLVVSVAKDLAL